MAKVRPPRASAAWPERHTGLARAAVPVRSTGRRTIAIFGGEARGASHRSGGSRRWFCEPE
ncbi:MAG: hypothetical protein BGP06_16245 [Rhizobiales bacterium 65-9]|nr:MAG: hypothetical protein BGP06_16245 [Rhizobiales bacterium 65-9]